MSSASVVLCPDSYKGSLPALAVARALRAGMLQTCPQAAPLIAPMADGGEGTLDCVATSRPGSWHETTLRGVHGEYMTGRWYQTDTGEAVIESAQVLGLPLIEACERPLPLSRRSSHALGLLLRDALDAGARRIVIGLGGSACNDAGLGLLTALGARALDPRGRALAPSMQALLALDSISLETLDTRLAEAEIRVLCDVDNPLLGTSGASRVYGPQKGLSEAEIDAVEAAFVRWAGFCNAEDKITMAGSGAAGGLGFALAALGGRLESGAEALITLTGLRARLTAADLVITGEGRSDRQTLAGKLPLAIARAAVDRPTVLVSGDIASDSREALERHFSACHTLVAHAGSIEAALAEPERWLTEIGTMLGRTLPRPDAGEQPAPRL